MRERQMVRTVLTAVAAGIAFGAAMRLTRHAAAPIPKLGSLGVPWLAVAFAAGALERHRRRAALAAAGTLAVAVVTYYLSQWLVEGRATLGYAARMGLLWSTGAALAGAAFGALGSAWRERVGGSTAAGAAISGAFAGEAVLLLGTWHSDAARAVLGCELAIGVALPFVLARRRELGAALALTAAVAVSLAVTEAAVRGAMHAAGWAGG